jgi:DNA-binding SARP family transcriptional activator
MRWGENSGPAEAVGPCPGAGPAVPAAKLRPESAHRHAVPADLGSLLMPEPGCVLLAHAPAGYRKTAALAVTQAPGWLWYNLDLGDRCPLAFAGRLCAVLDLEPLPRGLPPAGDLVAAELAWRLRGRRLTVTCDRYERLGDAPELARLLAELLALLPGFSLRVTTRVRLPLPLDRLRREGRLVDVGPAELRLRREEIERLLTAAWGAPPGRPQLDFADVVLDGWPAAVQLWQTAADLGSAESLRPGQPLHDYLEEEVFPALACAAGGDAPSDLDWLLGPGALSDRVATPEQRELADRLVEDRIGVVKGSGGWRLHPLVAAVVGMHVPSPRSQGGRRVPVTGAAPAGERPRVVIRGFGRLEVTVDGAPIDRATMPGSSRRLLELLLCLPGHRATSEQAARLLWPRHLRRSALNAFSVALHRLRRVLEPDLRLGAGSRYVLREGRTYRLCVERTSCDVAELWRLASDIPAELDEASAGRLEAAVRGYRGDLLATATDEFAREPRARLRDVALDALERLGGWHAAHGRWSAALGAYRRLLELEPRREDVWARLLECHLAAGHAHDAMTAVHRCEQALRVAGAAPSGLLRELRRRVLEHAC